MRRCLIGTSRCGTAAIHYYLLTEDREDGLLECYGILVTCGADMEMIRNITVSQSAILQLLEILIHGTVTPVSLRDVLEDWLLV